MGKILGKRTLTLSSEDKQKLSNILKKRLENAEDVSFVSRKITETYVFKTESAKIDLIQRKEKEGFSLFFEYENILVFEK